MSKIKFILVITLFLLGNTFIYSQRGPGGVSEETGTLTGCGGAAESTCGVWLDASEITGLPDGSDVNVWEDISLSADCDNATVPTSAIPPLYRNDPAFTINGLPTLTFEQNRYFVLSSSDDLNTTRVTYDKLVFMAFRTSEDISSKQTIYEEGGTVRGFNIMIHQGNIIIGAYDKQVDNDDGLSGSAGNTPAWGYSYITESINPNTTYILTAKFKAGAPGTLGNGANHFLQGWLNGADFGGPGNLIGGGNFNGFNDDELLGSLYDHPNPCGLGAVNDDTVDRDQVNGNSSGEWPFKGKLAELCYYKDEISESQRIIVQNYLAAKYLANLESGDFYSHEFIYGKDVIGIGRSLINTGTPHDLSQGKNFFRISTEQVGNPLTPVGFPAGVSANQWYMTGHNGLNLSWTNANVPNNSPNVQRLQRIWRIDRFNNNFSGPIFHEIDIDALPTMPSGFSTSNAKLVLLVDETSANIPDFTLPTTEVIEIEPHNSGVYDYRITHPMPDDAFYTFAWLKPEVQFDVTTGVGFESDPGPAFEGVTVDISLNYEPLSGSGGFEVTYNFTAVSPDTYLGPGPAGGDDFYYNSNTPNLTSQTVTIQPGDRSALIPVRIINDNVAEDPSTENFNITLISTNALGSEPTLLLGANSTLNFIIYDDDPDPKIGFDLFDQETPVNEATSSINVAITRDGTALGTSACVVEVLPGPTTALDASAGLDPQDYDPLFTATVNFPAGGPVTRNLTIPILNDDIDEPDEIIELRIVQITGDAAARSVPELDQTVRIVDNDIPVVSFAEESQSGFETVGAPSLTLTMDPRSARDVVVGFKMAAGTATFSQDFDGFANGSVVFPPFTEEAFVGPFFVYPDGLTEVSEDVIFSLNGTTPSGDATLDQRDTLRYNILDYEPFEWLGAAGVGQSIANVVWIDATQEDFNPSANKATLANRSPLTIPINQRNNPATLIANGINGYQALDFNGNSNPSNADAYEIANNVRINTAGTVDRLSYFFVFSPDVGGVPTSSANPGSPNTTHARLIYEQGGGTRGTSIYLYNRKLYFHVWNNANDDGNDLAATTDTIEGNQAPWGHNGNYNNSVYAESLDDIVAGQTYIVSCHYDNFSNEPLKIFVNGVKGTLSNVNVGYNQFGVGRLWGHAGRIGLGGSINATRFHFSNTSGSDRRCAFDGKLGEFITYHDPEFNEARRIIVENYLSAKWDIPLNGTETPQIWDLSDPEENLFSNQIAGIGEHSNGAAHGDAAGPGTILRVNSPNFDNPDTYVLWGANDEDLTNTWPFSQAGNLPFPVLERSGRIWKFYKSGGDATATFQISFAGSNNANLISGDISLLKLLTHTNSDPQDFSNATIYGMPSPAIGFPGGNVARFQNIPITDGMYLALGNTSSYFNTPLPIELLYFDARLNGEVVDLNWATATEINNDYFIIERASGDLIWEEILRVDGAGDSNSTIEYKDVDRTPLEGISYYRLKQVDFDGSFSYSNVKSVLNLNSDKELSEVTVFPNPSKSGNVFLNTTKDFGSGTTSISLVNISGQKVWQDSFENMAPIQELNIGDLPGGLYIVQVQNSEKMATSKLVIQD